MPGDFIDLYFSAEDDGIVIFGRFIESIQVLAVKDSQGHHVFTSSSNGIPDQLLFAVPDYFFILLRQSDLIRTNNIQLHPVPRNKEYTESAGDTMITSQEIVAFIGALAVEAAQDSGGQGDIMDPPGRPEQQDDPGQGE
jgi:hypothetical protein